MEHTDKAIMTCVLCKPMKIGDVRHEEGEVVHLDSELADTLANAGVVREATEDDLMGDSGEEDADNDADSIPADEPMEDSATVRRNAQRVAEKNRANAQRAVVRGAADGIKEVLKASRVAPLSTPHVAGSDEIRTGGFKNIGDYALSRVQARDGNYTAQKKVNRYKQIITKFSPPAMGAGAANAGEDMVPIQWAENLWKLSFKNVPDLLGMMTKYDMRYEKENIPTWNQPSAASAVQASVTNEGAAITATVGATDTVQLNLVNGTVLVNITDQLERFTPYHISTVIESIAPERIRYLTNNSVVNGTNNGVNLIGNASTVTVLPETPGSIQYQDILEMEAALFDDFEGDDTVWLCNKATLPHLYAMGFPNNAASTQVPVFTPGGFINPLGQGQVRAKGSLLGRPVYTLENVPLVGSRGSLILVSLKSLAAGYSGLIADQTPYLYFNQAIGTWRFMFYFNSVNPLTVPYTREYGGATSNIVILAAGSTSSS